MKIVIATGGFDPVHSGHIEYFKEAAALGDYFIVGLNSDAWLNRKKGRTFMPLSERMAIIENLKMVNEVMPFNDDSNHGADCIAQALVKFPKDHIIFANGGDRNHSNVPEQEVYQHSPRVSFVFGVGGETKRNSSRWILEEWRSPKTDRVWGNYRVIHETGKTLKVKELNVEPGKSLSMQKHQHRSEFWFVSQGYASVYTLENHSERLMGTFGEHQGLWLPTNKWHRLANHTNEMVKIVEIQYGSECSEMDITRL